MEAVAVFLIGVLGGALATYRLTNMRWRARLANDARKRRYGIAV